MKTAATPALEIAPLCVIFLEVAFENTARQGGFQEFV
jgi:hypothetical protein